MDGESIRTALYIIGWREKGPIKFGVATDPIKRVNDLQIAHPYRLRIYSAWWLHSAETAFAVESDCLKEVRLFALTGEWARITVEQARCVARCIFHRHGFEPERWKPTSAERGKRSLQFKSQERRMEKARRRDAAKEFEWLRNVTKR